MQQQDITKSPLVRAFQQWSAACAELPICVAQPAHIRGLARALDSGLAKGLGDQRARTHGVGDWVRHLARELWARATLQEVIAQAEGGQASGVPEYVAGELAAMGIHLDLSGLVDWRQIVDPALYLAEGVDASGPAQ